VNSPPPHLKLYLNFKLKHHPLKKILASVDLIKRFGKYKLKLMLLWLNVLKAKIVKII